MIRGRARWLGWVALVLLAAGGHLTTAAWGGRTDPQEPRSLLEIPLIDGRLDFADLLRQVLAKRGAEVPDALEERVWPIDVRSALGRAQLDTLRRMSDGAIIVEVTSDRVRVHLDTSPARRRVEDAEDAIERRLARVIGRLTESSREFGLTVVAADDERLLAADYLGRGGVPARMVVLVHGLDDPGWMWRDMVPALRGAGHVVARLEYPNDGPIADAADLLAWSLLELRAGGVASVDIVAHSMGGLVTRDVLTRPAYYDGDGGGDDRLPSIDRFIMCGTPNHGSEMVRLRAISEVKEQISRAFSDRGDWLGGLADGSGEAAEDLLPGSTFLRRLNDRPLATSSRHSIIAGRLSPVTDEDVARVGASVRKAARSAKAPAWLVRAIDRAEGRTAGVLDAAVRGVGDGCVTLDSARLDGVDDFVIVEADHISMIVNIIEIASGTPPAIPLVLERLARPHTEVAPAVEDPRPAP